MNQALDQQKATPRAGMQEARQGAMPATLPQAAPTAPAAARGMSAGAARRLEYAIIGLGLLALALIFQPFALGLFSVGCGLVVLAGLVNNLLPLARPGVPVRTVVKVALIVAVIFVIVTALSIGSAWLYGVYVEAQRGAQG